MKIIRHTVRFCGLCFAGVVISAHAATYDVSTVEELTTALANQVDGDVINIAAGTYDLTSQMELTAAVTVSGAGVPGADPSAADLSGHSRVQQGIDIGCYETNVGFSILLR